MKYLIVGFGKFGRIAIQRITGNFPDAVLTIVESDTSKTIDISGMHEIVHAEATAFLLNELLEDTDIVIPMVPFHLAASYVLAGIRGRAVPLPVGLEERLPNTYRLDQSNVFCSRADFVCPDDCPEGERCTVTGSPRAPLHGDLENIREPGWRIWVQRSLQILPGVGGYPLGDLRRLEQSVTSGLNMIATACKCHGVLTAIEVD